MGVVGRWHGIAHQAVVGETPLRRVNPGKIGDLVIRDDGTLYTEKKKMFGGLKRFEYNYKYDSLLDGYMVYSIEYGEYKLWSTIKDFGNKLIWIYADDVPLGFAGSALFFERG